MMYNMPQAKEHANLLYQLKADAGKGLKKRELTCKTTNIGLKRSLELINDWILKLVSSKKQQKTIFSYQKK